MSNSVGIISNPNSPAQNPAGQTASAAANAPAGQPDFKSQLPSAVQPTAPHDSDTPISPRIVVDPLAGPITEFLTTSGQVQAQIPSAAVVAYLRAGLTAEGFAKPTPETPHPDNKDIAGGNKSTDGSSVVA